MHINKRDMMNFKKGISIIIPTYKAAKYINKMLDCLKNQTIDKKLFDAIFIINGELDNTEKLIKKFMKYNPNLNIHIYFSDKGSSNARNMGIELSEREYSIFIDVDDIISDNYLKSLFNHAKEERIVIGTYFQLEDYKNIKEDYLTPPLVNNSGIIENPYNNEFAGILTIATDKLIPTKYIKKTLFNKNLYTGDDIAYYAEFYAKNDLEFYIVDKNEEAIYYRVVTQNSSSRQNMSYEFNITARLNSINDINKALKIAKSPEKISFIKSLTGGQVVFINKYLAKYPEDYTKVLKDISSYNFEFFPYKYLNESSVLDKVNNELIISYVFPPTNITTGNTVAKRILNNKNNVDVLSATTPSLNKDYEFNKVVEQFIIRKIEVDLDFSTEWSNIKEFIEKGMNQIENTYEKIYSRAFFPHSHFLALEYKLKHPETFWRAEFSDPLIYNFKKEEISSPINDKAYVNKINKIIPHNFKPIKLTDSLNFVCEYLTYIFADEIIFTNPNQLEVMMDLFPYEIDIKNKSKIITHPVLDEKYYYTKNSEYPIDENYINFAYFGVTYANRTLEDFIEGLDLLENKYKDKFRLHLFSPNKIMFEQVLSENIYEKTIINPVVDYLEFLNLSTKFDVLLVEDSQNIGNYIKNPYIPSKIWDYFGSETDIWAICEEDSVMNQMDIKYKSKINNLQSVKETANKIMKDKLNIAHDEDYKKINQLYNSNDENLKIIANENDKTNKYLKKRILELTTKIEELIEVAESEFRKDEKYLNEIATLKEENEKMKNSKSWKYTENLRKIHHKFK